MRYLLIALSAFLLGSCARTTAGVNIGAGQKFVLGEYMTTDYKASLRNKGVQTVAVRLVDKQSQETRTEIKLAPKEKTSLKVSPDVEVQLINASSTDALLYAEMSKTISGMQYMGIDEKKSDKQQAAWEKPTRPKAPKMKYPFSQLALIPAGATYYFAEGQPAVYSAILQNQGNRGINVRIRNRQSGKQTQGFGLGNYGSPTVFLSEGEVLTLVNTGSKPAKIKLKLSQELSGQRLTPAMGK